MCYIRGARERGIMKKVYNYTFQLVCIYILVLSLFSISNFEIKIDYYDSKIRNINQEKVISSLLFANNYQQEDKEILEEENVKQIEETSTQEPEVLEQPIDVVEPEKVEKTPTKVEEVVNLVDTSSFAVLAEEIVNISHYGHDCYGCTSGYTASGYYVGDGRIYYQDSTFGSVRVVAADSKYPLGTILRLDYHGSLITAIVLDRGGAIGDGNRFQIDLLTTSNSKAYELGIVQNTHLEVLRLGY